MAATRPSRRRLANKALASQNFRMSAAEPDPRIEALRLHLGEKRFFRFIAMLPSAGRLLFWQARELDLLEHERGIVLPRDGAELTLLLSPLLPSHPTLSAESLPGWIVFEEFWGAAPVQATGSVLHPAARFYFRARHEHWTIGVTKDPEVDPVDVGGTKDDCFFHKEEFGYQRDEASYMPLDARFFIVRELTSWRESRMSAAG